MKNVTLHVQYTEINASLHELVTIHYCLCMPWCLLLIHWMIIKINMITIIFQFAGASTPTSAHFGQGTGQIWLDDLRCTGTEARLVDCGHRSFGVHNCSHNKDVSTRCIPYFCKLGIKLMYH